MGRVELGNGSETVELLGSIFLPTKRQALDVGTS